MMQQGPAYGKTIRKPFGSPIAVNDRGDLWRKALGLSIGMRGFRFQNPLQVRTNQNRCILARSRAMSGVLGTYLPHCLLIT
jgi:hypothetical protein